MSDSPVSDAIPQKSGSPSLMMIVVFFLGVLAGFIASAALNGKFSGQTDQRTASQEAAQETAPPQAEQPPSAHVPDPATAAGGVEHMDSEKPAHEMELTPQARDRLMSFDFLNLLQDAELHRYRFEGETKGLKLSKIRTGSFYSKAGFQDGDIIEEINGLAFADLEKNVASARQELPAANQLTFKVRRDDKIIKIKIKVAAPAKP